MGTRQIPRAESNPYDGKIFAEPYLKKMERDEEGTVQAIAKRLQTGFRQAHREREEEFETLRSNLEQVIQTHRDWGPKMEAAAATQPPARS